MKFLLTVAAVIAVAVASPTKRELVTPGLAGAAPVLAPEDVAPIAIGPAIIDSFEPIAIGPAIVDGLAPISVGPAIVEGFEPISVGPAIIDFPLPDGGAVSAPVESVIQPSPVVVGPVPEGSSPLVQIIVNVNQAAGSAIVPVAPVVIPEIPVSPVIVVDEAVNVDPVIVVDEAQEVVPVEVIDVAPVPVEPVIIGTPIIPSPAVILPDELN